MSKTLLRSFLGIVIILQKNHKKILIFQTLHFMVILYTFNVWNELIHQAYRWDLNGYVKREDIK